MHNTHRARRIASMDVSFAEEWLRKLEQGNDHGSSLSQALIQKYQQRMQFIRAALDERDFYNMKSLHFEKLKGDREHQRSIRLNLQWRLILELRGDSPKTVHVVSIEDYH